MKSPQSIVKRGRVLVIGDVHVPFHDKKAWNLLLEVIAYTRPDAIVQIGDYADMLAVSAHPPAAGEKHDLDRELKEVRKEWGKLEAAAGSAMLVHTAGNHEHRLSRYIAKNARAIEGIVTPLKELMGMSEDVIVRPYQEMFHIGRVGFVHDLGYCGKTATAQTLEAAGQCVVHGHDHRGTVVYNGDTNGNRWFGLGTGCLADLSKITYMPPAKTRQWSLGFGIVDYVDGLAFAQFVPYVRGKFFLEGRLFK